MTTSPLAGITVLDFTKTLAGPLCTQTLGDLGATVIKVESPGAGDDTRTWPPFRAEGLSAVFLSVNRNKQSISLNLKTEQGRAIAHKLAAKADVAIESFGTGVAERLGIDAKTLQGINPALIHCTISGYGRTGPLKDLPGYDVVLQAFSGMMSLTGEAGGGHIRSPISPIDQVTGMHAVTGIMAALLGRAQTGRGTTVQVNLFETALGLLRYNLQSFWEQGVQPERCGSTHEGLAPYRVFEASDGPVLLGVANDSLWSKFTRVAGLEDIADDPRFRTNAARVRNRAQTEAIVQEAVSRHPVSFWSDEMAKANVPCAPVNSLAEVLAHPHTNASGIIMDYQHPVGGPTKAVALPLVLGDKARSPGSPPPLPGEHTVSILEDLGYTPEKLIELREAGVIA
ncbi:CaiB/BaiF CoA transferase family protein [Microbacterium pygmaeum]|uniref:Crotonobetainyl-CoA:carnitine CoA-transferase CaiB n=1 Tax=Microbacterium pygmaeum TaxID=370764 RepID=A0A1G7XKV7_9MICO|nr:CoA transferase [Microbacterium pygmaeum]SDG84852.1 Crotonobetainyl-CoA:carnitine CoA-transferase CaiB [Microbacterium pygmaeum]